MFLDGGTGNNNIAADVEDIFTPKEYVEMFNAAFDKELGSNRIKVSELPPGERIVERISRHLKDCGITVRPSGGFNHYAVASYIAASPRKKFDPKTLSRFENIFKAINLMIT